MALSTLSIDLVAKLAQFEKDMGAAARSSEKMAERVGRAMGVVASAVTAVAGAGLTAVFVAGTKATADYQDALGKLAQRSGVAVEAMSGLAYAADLADVSRQELQNGLRYLSQEIDNGGAKLKALGITSTTTEGALSELADLFAKMPDGVRKTAIAADLFGSRSGPQLITLLNAGSAGLREMAAEAERFGLIVTEDAAKAAETFNDNMTRLAKGLEGVKIALTTDLVKGLGDASGAFLKAAAEGSKFAGVLAFIQTLLTGNDRHKANVEMTESAERILQIQNAMDKIRSKGADNLTGQDAATLRNLQRELGERMAAFNRAKNYGAMLDAEEPAARPSLDGGPRGGQGGTAKAIKEDKDYLWHRQQWLKSYDEWAKYHEEIRKREAATVDAAAKIIGDAYEDEAKGIEQWRRTVAGRGAEMDKELFRLSGGADDARKRSLTSRLEEQLNSGISYTPEQLDKIVKGIAGITDETSKARDVAVDFASVFESGFEKAILSGEKLSSVLKALGMDILQITIRNTVTKPLANAASGWLSGMLGGLFGGLFGGARAEGGPVDAGKTYLVGERGPELFRPSRNGKIIPNGGGGNTTVINNFTVGDVASMSKVREAIAASQRATAGSLMRSRQYGGAFA